MKKYNIINEIINELIQYDFLDYLSIYKRIINYKVNDNSIDIKFMEKYKNKIEYFFDSDKNELVFGNNINIDMGIELILSLKENKYNLCISKIINYLSRKKVKFRAVYFGKYDSNNLFIVVNKKNDVVNLIEYINGNISTYFYNANRMGIIDSKVAVSFYNKYSYYEVFAMHLKMYIELYKNNLVKDFKRYLIDSYCEIKKCNNLEKYLWFNEKNVELSVFFENIKELTLVLFKRICDDSVYDLIDCLNDQEFNKKDNIYLKYDDFSFSRELFIELIENMYLKYGIEDTKENILKYKETKKNNYITRSNNLRKKIINSDVFMVYLYSIDTDKEISNIVLKFEEKKRRNVLEDVCKKIFKLYQNENGNYSGKVQVARTLIRMSYGDFSTITRVDGIRKMAINNIKPDEVIDIIKKSLQIDWVIKECELYEMYAEYIQLICSNGCICSEVKL